MGKYYFRIRINQEKTFWTSLWIVSSSTFKRKMHAGQASGERFRVRRALRRKWKRDLVWTENVFKI